MECVISFLFVERGRERMIGSNVECRLYSKDYFNHQRRCITSSRLYLVTSQVETSKGRVVVSLWDTAGEEKFDSLTR